MVYSFGWYATPCSSTFSPRTRAASVCVVKFSWCSMATLMKPVSLLSKCEEGPWKRHSRFDHWSLFRRMECLSPVFVRGS